jgi:PEP-CTERM motif
MWIANAHLDQKRTMRGPMAQNEGGRIMKMLLGAAIVTILAASPANATLQISFSNGASTFFCADQTACDLSPTFGSLLLGPVTVGDIQITGALAKSDNFTSFGSQALSLGPALPPIEGGNLTITNLSTTQTETLDMALGEIDFPATIATIRLKASPFPIPNGAALTFFADRANEQPAENATDLPGMLLATSATLQSDGFGAGVQNAPFVPNSLLSFSMSEGASITLLPRASITNFNVSMTNIPEPATWAMMLVGFAGLGFAGYRRAREQRAAV